MAVRSAPALFVAAALACAAPSLALAQEPGDAPLFSDAQDDGALGFALRVQAQVSGLFGENFGGLVAPGLRLGEAHTLELALFVAGGSHLRTGVELRYRLEASELLSWWVGPGVAFDVLFAGEDTTLWTRLTTLSTGLDLALTESLYVGLQFSFIPRVAPLAVTFVEQGDTRRQVEREDADELLFDLADFVLRPGVSIGFRL